MLSGHQNEIHGVHISIHFGGGGCCQAICQRDFEVTWYKRSSLLLHKPTRYTALNISYWLASCFILARQSGKVLDGVGPSTTHSQFKQCAFCIPVPSLYHFVVHLDTKTGELPKQEKEKSLNYTHCGRQE